MPSTRRDLMISAPPSRHHWPPLLPLPMRPSVPNAAPPSSAHGRSVASRASSRCSSSRAGARSGPGEVAIAVRASALDHRDLNIVASRYGPAKPATRVPLSDGSGEIVALGADITVNYRSRPDWHVAVREATGSRGVDIVVETAGFATLPQSRACAANGLQPKIDRSFGFDEAPAAYRYLQGGSHIGKVIVRHA